MALAESGSMSRLFRVDYGDRQTFVFLSGEHDLSTALALRHLMAEAIARNDADLVVDLSQVDFMGASTVGVIVRAREFLFGAPPRAPARLRGLTFVLIGALRAGLVLGLRLATLARFLARKLLPGSVRRLLIGAAG